MSTYLVVNNSSLLCSSTASAPYIQVDNECLPLTTQTDRGRTDIHVTDEQTTYNVINLTTTTREMTVEETVATTGYSGTYEDYIGSGTVISSNSVTMLKQQIRAISYNKSRYSSGVNAFCINNPSMSVPNTYSYTYFSNSSGGIVGASTYTQSTTNNASMWLHFRDGLSGASSTYTRANYASVTYDGAVGTFTTTSLVSSKTATYSHANTSSVKTSYSISTYYGSGRLYDGVSTYSSYNSISDSIASVYTEVTLSSSSTLTETITEEVTSSSFTTQTYTETQTRNATIWSASTSEEASGSCTTTVLSASYGQGYQTVNSSSGGAYQTYMTYRYSNIDVDGTMSKTDYQAGEQTLPCHSTYVFENSTGTRITHQASWWYAGRPDGVTVTNNSYTTIDQSTYTGGGYNYSVTQTTNSSAFDTYSTYSTSIESLRTNTMRRTTYSSYETTETSSVSNETYSNSYTAEITETFTHTETVTGEV